MTEELVRLLLPVVNQNKQFLEEYANWRIAFWQATLEHETDIGRVREIQGHIKEARRLLTLRDEVLALRGK